MDRVDWLERPESTLKCISAAATVVVQQTRLAVCMSHMVHGRPDDGPSS